MKKKFEDYKAGDKIDGKTIKRVYLSRSNYVFYRLKWENHFIYDTEDGLTQKIAGISDKYSDLDNYITKREKRKHIPSLIRAHSHALDDSPELGIKLLDKVKVIIEEKRKSNGKVLYLLIYFLSFPCNLFISYLLFQNDTYIEGIIPFDLPNIYLIGTLGSIGGFFSFNSYVQDIKVSPDQNIFYHIFFVLYRIAIAMFASVAMYTAIKANIVLGFIDTIGDDYYLIYFLSMAAGYSEKLVPNLFINAGKKIEIADEKSPPIDVDEKMGATFGLGKQ